MESVVLNGYLEQIRKYLPPWKMDELVKEIRSHILDQVDALASERQQGIDETLMKEVIDKLGPPEKLAAGYIQPVTLIKPEYSIQFLFYTAIAGLIGLLFSGLTGLLAGIALSVIFFVALSQASRVYHLPFWPYTPKNVVLGIHYKGKKKMSSNSLEEISEAEEAKMNANAVITPRMTFWDRMIARSQPRPLRPAEIFAVAMKIVVALGVAAVFIIAAEPMRLLSLHVDQPQHGFDLKILAPGLDAIRPLFLLGCFATVAYGVTSIIVGKTRSGLLIGILGQLIWALIFGLLAFGSTDVLTVDFQSLNPGDQRDWTEVRPFIPLACNVLFIVLFIIQLFTLAGKITRLGMMQAWYQMNEKT